MEIMSEQNKRLCTFRMPEDVVQRLIDLGKLPSDYDRKTLSGVAMQVIEDAIGGDVPQKEIEKVNEKLDYLANLLEGKQSPQAA